MSEDAERGAGGQSRERRGRWQCEVASSPLSERASGVLLHPTSLPGTPGCGSLGPAALAFVDWLVAAGQRWWQMLPVVVPGYGESPYSAQSAFAGSALLISSEWLEDDGWVARRAANPHPDSEPAEFAVAHRDRERVLREAFTFVRSLPSSSSERRGLRKFEANQSEWLEDWSLFAVLKARSGGVGWTDWLPAWRDRAPDALELVRREFAEELAFHRFVQWVFDRQWARLRTYCAAAGVLLLGDVPIFVAHDSADVWAHRQLFHLDRRGLPNVVSGVPPDYFSATGQRWGNPLYRWSVMRRDGYQWWLSRFQTMLARFDAVRLDHFVGFYNYWEIPVNEPTAMRGRWVKGPGAHFFASMREHLGGLPFVAEDLGAVTKGVSALRDIFELPGMKVLQFAFGDDPSAPEFLPHVYPRRSLACTGTHDNDTVVGWFQDLGDGERSKAQVQKERGACLAYLGTDGQEIHWEMIREVMKSVAALAVFPVQDVLGLGSEARMNRPGTNVGNWNWRLASDALSAQDAARLAELVGIYGRGSNR